MNEESYVKMKYGRQKNNLDIMLIQYMLCVNDAKTFQEVKIILCQFGVFIYLCAKYKQPKFTSQHFTYPGWMYILLEDFRQQIAIFKVV